MVVKHASEFGPGNAVHAYFSETMQKTHGSVSKAYP